MKYADIPAGEWGTLWACMDADGLFKVCDIHKQAIAKYPTLSTYLMSLPQGEAIVSAYSVRFYLYNIVSTKAQKQLSNFWDITVIYACSENKFTKREISFIIDLLKQEDLRLHRLRRRKALRRKKENG